MPKNVVRRTPRNPGEPLGQVTAVVAVTGVMDQVNDILTPGIFGPALAKRKPKVVFHHDPKDFVGRIVRIYELPPGDARLPKKQPDGQPWPAEAGALIAVMQFNMATQRGRDVYEWARFYAETGEAAWSIGYTVPQGMSAKRAGIRHIFGIDLFEVSLVLHGAHPLTMALEVKSAQQPDARDGVEFKEARGGVAQPSFGEGVMVALYPPAEVAEALAVPGGSPAEDLHITLAYLGDTTGAGFSAADVADALRPALAGHAPLAGQVGGLGQFPAGDTGVPVYAPVDVPGLEKVREAVVDALEAHPATAGATRRNHGFTPHMTLGYDLADTTPVPPTDATFGDVVIVYGTERTPLPLGAADDQALEAVETKHDYSSLAQTPEKDNWVDQVGGLPAYVRAVANALVRDGHTRSAAIALAVGAMKRWARGGDDVNPDTIAKAQAALTEWEAMKLAARADNLETKSALWAVTQAKTLLPPTDPTPTPETSMNTTMTGSYQELIDNVMHAVRKRHETKKSWVCAEATFPDSVVYTVHLNDGPGAETYQTPYTTDPDGKVTLGAPVKVKVERVLVPDAPAAPAPSATERALAPTIEWINEAAAAFTALPVEGKSLRLARPAVASLLDALAGKGMDVPGLVLGEDEDEDYLDLETKEGDDLDELDDPDLDPEEGAPAGDPLGNLAPPPAPPAEIDPDGALPGDEVLPGPADELISMSPADIEADLASLDLDEDDEDTEDDLPLSPEDVETLDAADIEADLAALDLDEDDEDYLPSI